MSHRAWLVAVAAAGLATTLALAGCNSWPSGTLQGWDTAARDAWYNADQGSRMMPLPWFEALEQPDAGSPSAAGAARRFADPAYLANFRILPPAPGQTLPVGFAVDRIDDSGLVKTNLHWRDGAAGPDRVDWVGLNCAACHTGQMTYGGQTVTVQGAPSLFDFQSFIEAADQALAQTRASAAPGADPGRWNRFAAAVLGSGADTPAARRRVLGELDKLIAWETQTEALNHTDLRSGFGRVDAIGHIYNRVLLFGGAPQPVPNPADAPVSYPQLWNITRQTQLQWDGIVRNAKINVGAIPTDYGALGRNTGEVLGVFGEAVIKAPTGPGDLSGFVSSVDVTNLNALEVLLTRLQPPAWPAATFGTPGEVEVKDAAGRKLSRAEVLGAGQALFTAQCAQCHTPHEHYETLKTFAQMGPDLTDEWMACNAWAFTGASGAFTGIPADYASGEKLEASAPVRALLTTTVKGAMIGKKSELVQAAGQNIFGATPLPRVVKPGLQLAAPQTPKDRRLALCRRNADNPLLAYKARPLEGVWATAPYLHNGSVPTLYDLLQPVSDRPQTFRTGTRAFDPKKVGYDTRVAAAGNSFVFDTRLAGNSNKGHVYGVGALTATQRLELLEYLKSL